MKVSFDVLAAELCASFMQYRDCVLRLQGVVSPAPAHRATCGSGELYQRNLDLLIDEMLSQHFRTLVEVLAVYAGHDYAPPGGVPAYVDAQKLMPFPCWRGTECDLPSVVQKLLKLLSGDQGTLRVYDYVAFCLKHYVDAAASGVLAQAQHTLVAHSAVKNEPGMAEPELTEYCGQQLQGLLNHLNVFLMSTGHAGFRMTARELWTQLQCADDYPLVPELLWCQRYGEDLGFRLAAPFAQQLHTFISTYDRHGRRFPGAY